MSYNLLTHLGAKISLLGLHVLVQGFFLGQLISNVPVVRWPYNMIVGYILGLVASGFIAFILFKKWHASLGKRVVVATVVLAIVIAAGVFVSLWTMQLEKARLEIIFGLVGL